jgi:hypothetical protein
MRLYHSRTDGRHRNGRRVRVFIKAGRKFVHVEFGPYALGMYR